MKTSSILVIKTVIFCSLFLSIHGVSYENIICDKFTMIAKINGRSLMYSLETDLPDNTNVIVSISRSYVQKNNIETYSEEYYKSNKTVGQLRLINIVTLDDNQWCQLLAKKQSMMERGNMPFVIDKISDDISISITFHINQSDPVFDKFNKNVTGKMINEKRTTRSIQDEKNITLPLTVKYDFANFKKDIAIELTKQSNTNPNQSAKPAKNQPKHKYSSTYTDENGIGITVGGQVACFSKVNLEDMEKFVVAKDKSSFDSYVNLKKCMILKGGDKVTVMEYPGLFGGFTKFAYHGVMLWTRRDGIAFE
jgi:hypothetical protein